MKSAGAKSRLSAVLSTSERRVFARLLLGDVILAIRQAGLLRSSYVVSPDGEILSFASLRGIHTISEPADSGVNSAVTRGINEAGGTGMILVIPSDLPLLRSSELRSLISLGASGLDVVITPSSAFDGTNALLFSAASPLQLSYDDNSFWNHMASVSREGLSLGVCSQPGIMFDVDSAEDFRKLAGSGMSRPSARFARRILS